jgi:hypothetical protein
MAVDLCLALDEATYAEFAASAERDGTTMEEALRRALLEAAGRNYERPDGIELLSSSRSHLMLDLRSQP